MTTGERIRNARIAAGMTLAELAQKMNVSYQVIQQWENDKRKPKSSSMSRIADALGVNVTLLYGLSNDFLKIVIQDVDGNDIVSQNTELAASIASEIKSLLDASAPLEVKKIASLSDRAFRIAQAFDRAEPNLKGGIEMILKPYMVSPAETDNAAG